ncbi:hypothetical protein Q762_10780 [Flavobacterium cauense R2A-7]|nr:hypothetical protein [Flavobacterium cauense]KGO80568.1 hypothetical protein Q762_10780 [Flavobacterium cauense R2A-7]
MQKTIFLILFLILMTTPMFAEDTIQRTIINQGVGLGTVIAVVTSWSRNKSILLAIIHGIFSWLYVIYFALTDK